MVFSKVTVYHKDIAWVVLFNKDEGYDCFAKGVEEAFDIKAKIRIMKNIRGGIIPLTDSYIKTFDKNDVVYIAYDGEPDPEPPLSTKNYYDTLNRILNPT